MCRHVKSYILLIIGLSLIGTICVQFGNFWSYWSKRSKDWEKAIEYLNTNTCSDPYLRSKLGNWNLCEKSENTLNSLPIMSAIYDVASDLHICGHERCKFFYMDVTANLHKLIIAIGVIAIGMVWVSRKNIQYNNNYEEYYKYGLPHMQLRDK